MFKELFDKYGSDKGRIGYGPIYDFYFAPLKNLSITLLELGVWRGASLFTWREFFPHAQIIGIDNENIPLIESDRISIYKGTQTDPHFLNNLILKYEGFDIIVDDAGHRWLPQQESFNFLWDTGLRPGGLYVIEDLGTSFDSSFSDNYNLNTVEFLMRKATTLVADENRTSSIEFIHFYPNQAVIKKRNGSE